MPRRACGGRQLRRSLALLCALALAATTLPEASAAPPPTHRPPVDAPVVDPFRPPEHPYGPGNRGLLYGTEPGTEVRATAAGVVTFAGTVAGSRHVTVRHADGLRTSYSFLDEVRVAVGQRVEQGQVLGTTAGQLHLGARVGDAYLDPASLFGGHRVHLVPFEEPPGQGEAGERSALRQLVGGIGGALGGLGRGLGGGALRAASWLRGEGGQLLRTFGHYALRLNPQLVWFNTLRVGATAVARAREAARRPCTPAGQAPPRPSGRRVAVLVAGLGSSSEEAAIDEVDTDTLGYQAPDVLRFSYAGGRTPDPGDGLRDVPAAPYEPSDTQEDLQRAGVRLADLLEDVARHSDGAPIDVLAHSQGGLVTRLALVELERRHGEAWFARLGQVATLGTPHGGADLATGVHAMANTPAGSVLFDGAQAVLDLNLDDDGRSVAQLSETSEVVGHLRDAGIPGSVDLVSIAARGDLVVPVPRTAVDGGTHVVVPIDGLSAHDSLPGSPEASRELALALAGLPPTCQGFGSALGSHLLGEGISYGEDVVGALGWATTVGTSLVAMAP